MSEMLVVSYERLIPTEINVMSLHSEGYFYSVDRATYDSCVILSSKYSVEEILELVKEGPNTDIIEWFAEMLPRPLKVLAPFLNLLENEIDQDLEDCVKAIHVMTNTLNINKYIEVPREVRKSVSFSLSVVDEAEISYAMFNANSIPVEDFKALISGQFAGGSRTSSDDSSRDYSTPSVQSTPVAESTQVEELDLETATADDLRAHPDWFEISNGVFGNLITEAIVYADVPEDQEFEDRIANSLAGIGQEEEEEVEEPQAEEQPKSGIMGVLL